MVLIFHFKCSLKCHLQFVAIWTSLKVCHLVGLNDKILHLSKLKEYTDDKINMTHTLKLVLQRVEYIVGKGETH